MGLGWHDSVNCGNFEKKQSEKSILDNFVLPDLDK
jgi:hypothetical protein